MEDDAMVRYSLSQPLSVSLSPYLKVSVSLSPYLKVSFLFFRVKSECVFNLRAGLLSSAPHCSTVSRSSFAVVVVVVFSLAVRARYVCTSVRRQCVYPAPYCIFEWGRFQKKSKQLLTL